MENVAQLDGVDPQVDAKDHLRTLITEWELWMDISRGLLPNTRKLYARTVEIAGEEIPSLWAVSTSELESWVQSKGGRSSTVSNRVSALASFFRFLVKTKRRPDNPAAEMDRPKRHKGIPKPVPDLEAALRVLDDYDCRTDGIPNGQSRAIATFIAETGLRISEACSVNVEVPAPAQITVIGKGNKEAIVLLTDKARDALDRLGGSIPIGARAIQRRFERAGFHPHQLRHWRATSLVQAGIEIGTISKVLRHSSPSITMVYAQYDQSTMRAALDKVR